MSIGRTRLTDIVADVWAIAADTDGIDGSEDNAGAVLAPDNIRKGGDAKDRPAKNDRYGFFGERGENRLDLPYVEIARAKSVKRTIRRLWPLLSSRSSSRAFYSRLQARPRPPRPGP